MPLKLRLSAAHHLTSVQGIYPYNNLCQVIPLTQSLLPHLHLLHQELTGVLYIHMLYIQESAYNPDI